MMINVVKSDGRIKESVLTHQTTFDYSSRIHQIRWLLTFVSNCRSGSVRCPPLSAAFLSSAHYVSLLGPAVAKRSGFRTKKVTWLILPVVICLSQRLSHACLSINNFILWNCERLIISAIIYLMVSYYMDNCSNSRANTCVKSRLSRGGMYLLDKKPMRALSGFVVNHSNFSNRMASRRR